MLHLDEHPTLYNAWQSVKEQLPATIIIGTAILTIWARQEIDHLKAEQTRQIKNTYTELYLGQIGCLEGTTFDTAQGATIYIDGPRNNVAVTIKPQAQEARGLSPLRFSWADSILAPSDQRSVAILEELNC